MAEHIEAFTAAHLEECAHLLMTSFNAEPWNEKWTLNTSKKTLEQTLLTPGFLGFVSVEDEILAFATGCCEQDDEREVFYLDTLCVRPDSQGTGVGSRLLEHLKEHLDKSEVSTIYLITHRGTPAEHFYRKNGYRVSDEDIVMIYEWGKPHRG